MTPTQIPHVPSSFMARVAAHSPQVVAPFVRSRFAPIVFAEVASSVVSLGAVLAVSHFDHALKPVRDFIARKVIYPVTEHKAIPQDIAHNDPAYKKARDHAGLLIKGTAMVGAGVVAHLPIQRALEGKHGGTMFNVARGKIAGVGVAIGCIIVLNKMTGIFDKAEHAAVKVVSRFLPEKASKQLSSLAITDSVSSALSATVNALTTGVITLGI